MECLPHYYGANCDDFCANDLLFVCAKNGRLFCTNLSQTANCRGICDPELQKMLQLHKDDQRMLAAFQARYLADESNAQLGTSKYSVGVIKIIQY